LLDRSSVLRILAVTLAGIVIGTASSLAAAGFVSVISWANRLLLIEPSARDAAPPALVALATICVPTLGGLAVGLLISRAVTGGAPLGPADAILAVQLRKRMPDRHSSLAGILAALVALCTGGSVGQYGPLVFMGAAIGAQVRRMERRIRDIRSIAIACGVAGAIAAAFNAPIAGLIFAHEVILRHYAIRAFAPIAVAAATGHVAAYALFGGDPILGVSFEGIVHNYEYFFFAAEGVLAAYLATAYMALILAFDRLGARLPVTPALRPALAGLGVGLLALQVPEVLGVGRDALIRVSESGAFTMTELAVLLVAKILATALCIGFGMAGGVFSPALLIGGFGGALYGLGLDVILPVETTGVLPYAICGMMAVASPVIGAPMTTILIVFELTGSYELTIATMTAVAFANLVGHRTFGRSLFDVQLLHRGYDLSEGRDRAILAARRMTDLLSQDYARLRPDEDVAHLIAICREEHRAEVLLIDEAGKYAGRVRLQDALEEPGTARLSEITDTSALVFGEETSLWEGMALLQGFVGQAVPFVAPDGRLKGVIPVSAVIYGYFEATRDLRREENAGA
jgi:chloride channel protein, CIC family